MKQTSFNFDFPEEPIKPEVKAPAKPAEKMQPAKPTTPIEVEVRKILEKESFEKTGKRGRMKISDMEASVHLVEVPDDDILFSKSYYSMGEVTNMFRVNHSLIRYWESEFSILKPKKNAKGDRFFRPEDVKNLRMIYHLLRERKYTIEGAKDFLKKNKLAEKKFEMIQSLKSLQGFLHELKAGV
jgi:DNA-binding transcriptional MerR regulator